MKQRCGNGNYCPADLVNREQMAAFIVRAKEGEPTQDYCASGSPFGDVPVSSLFCRYIKRLAELGITSGCGNGNYCPTLLVSRDQMAAFLVRAMAGEPALDYCTGGSGFLDVPVTHPFCRYIKRLAELRVTGGCGGGNYCPGQIVNREQMAIFLTRAFLGLNGDIPSSRLWHNNSVLNGFTGSQIAYTDTRAPVTLTGNLTARPWPDGSQYAIYDYDVFGERTDVSLIDTSTGALLYTLRFNGYARNLRPSPTNKAQVLITWGDDSVAPSWEIVADFATGAVPAAMDSADGFVRWLPDGRYLRISPTGQISAATVGGNWVAAGQVAIPTGREIGQFWVNPQGTQMAIRMVVFDRTNHVDETDLWVSNIDGSGLARYTQTGITSYAHWAPDGRRIAFDVDTGSTCDYGGCYGTCELWHSDATARNVRATSSSGDALHFLVRNTSGQNRTLGCALVGWTD